jgi:hypothetical protein
VRALANPRFPTLSEAVSIHVGFPWVVLCGDSRRADRLSNPWNRTGKSVTRNEPDNSATD